MVFLRTIDHQIDFEGNRFAESPENFLVILSLIIDFHTYDLNQNLCLTIFALKKLSSNTDLKFVKDV